MGDYILEIKTNKRTGTVVFFIIWIFLVSTGLLQNKIPESNIVVFISGIAVIGLYLLWAFFGSVVITINDSNLLLAYRISKTTFFTRSFSLVKINAITKQYNDVSGRLYDRMFKVTNPVAIYFDYDGSKKKIGEGLQAFDAEGVIDQLNNRVTKAKRYAPSN